MELVQRLPAPLWDAPVVGEGRPRRTVRIIAAHIHNSRCSWVKTLGREHGIPTPVRVDQRRVTRRQLVAALKRSAHGIESILRLGLDSGGTVPPSKGYVWRNLALDVGHVLTYFVAHEGHHRGQILMALRQLGEPVSRQDAGRLWWWKPSV
jgi:uncharacterized damage-inducible protein DinB